MVKRRRNVELCLNSYIWLIFFLLLTFQLGFIFTWYCASSKDVKAVQQNSEVDLKTHQIFPDGELLEDLSLDYKESMSVISSTIRGCIHQKLNLGKIFNILLHSTGSQNIGIIYLKQTHLDESIGLQTFRVLNCDFQAVGCSAEDGMVFEGYCFQYVRQIASIIHTGH